MPSDRKTVLARITGRVQGVSFRVWTRDQAQRLRLNGWVRNEDDGSVTALISGAAPAVTALVELLSKGPPGAAVAHVAVQDAEDQASASGFRIAS